MGSQRSCGPCCAIQFFAGEITPMDMSGDWNEVLYRG